MERRFWLLGVVLALLSSGCLGDSSTKTVHPGLQPSPTNLVVKVLVEELGQGQTATAQTYRISCVDTGAARGAEEFHCDQLTGSNRDRYFGVPSGPISAGLLQGAVTIRGIANGVRVRRSYYLGSKQFRDWMLILNRDPSGLVVEK